MPRWTFENIITTGNLLQIATLIFGIIAAWYVLVGNVAANTSDILGLQKAVLPIESLNVRLTVVESRAETADKQLQAVVSSVDDLVSAINADRLTSGRNDAEIRKDVGYLRDWVEEQKRNARP